LKAVQKRLEALLGDAVERSLEAHEDIEQAVRARRGRKGKAGQKSAPLELPPELTTELHEVVLAKIRSLASISGGSTALCEVTVTIEDANRNKVSSKAVGEDIVTTSVQAVIDGINRIMLKNILHEKQLS
jgi:hypothetical protein